MQVPLPHTHGRLSQSCYLYCTGGGNTSLTNAISAFLTSNDLQANSSVDPVSVLSGIVNLLGASTPLGHVDNLLVHQSREVERVYGIGAHAFDPSFMVPKAVQTSLELNNIVIYDRSGGDFLSALGFNAWNLYYQQSPVIIRQDLDNPDGHTPESVLYLDCWITELPTRFDLSSDTGNLVRQNVIMTCGRVLASSSLYGNIRDVGSTGVSKSRISFT